MPNTGGLVSKNSQNATLGHHIHNYSTFDESLSYRIYNTHRFGDYIPTFDMEGVEKDEIRLNSCDRIDSLSLNAPFKGSIRKIKESFKVPNMAILPLQWDRIYTQPVNGDDVPQDANCVLLNFPAKMKALWLDCANQVFSMSWSSPATSAELCTFYTGLMRLLVLGEYVYSSGSLLNVSGYKYGFGSWLYPYVVNSTTGEVKGLNYDQWFDAVVSKFFNGVLSLVVTEPVGSGTAVHPIAGIDSTQWSGRMSFRSMLEIFRENPLSYISSLTISADTTLASVVSDIRAELSNTASNYGVLFNYYSLVNETIMVPPATTDTADETYLNQTTLNLSRLLAYQLVCAHFYSNSSVDFIFSAELYRQYIRHLENGISGTNSLYQFTWNGMYLPYDYLSGHTLIYTLCIESIASVRSNFLSNFLLATPSPANALQPLALWSAIFGYRKSLRYGDYFIGSRPRPLAPINTDVAVNSNTVSVIDITRRIQAQRFANAVARTRSKIDEYVESLFGHRPAPDYHNPFYLSRETEVVFGDAVQNTGSNQLQDANSRTSNFASNLGRYTFTFHNDDNHPCIYLQIVSYDTQVAYSRSVDRQFLHIDRFDMFNPDFQYIGDQPVYGIELGYNSGIAIPSVFSYQTRDMEYKQRFNQSCSGFSSGSLPGWCFNDSGIADARFTSISPDFIRSRNVDLDRFFLSLTGYSLGTYFHFVCITDNNVSAKRAMAVDPQILA